jgi:hypothetical protein
LALKRRAQFSPPLRGSKSESNVAKNQFVQKLKLQTTSNITSLEKFELKQTKLIQGGMTTVYNFDFSTPQSNDKGGTVRYNARINFATRPGGTVSRVGPSPVTSNEMSVGTWSSPNPPRTCPILP